MEPLSMGLIAGGANLLGSVFSADTSAKNTQAQIQASMAEQANQNQFTEMMSNTAYQRATADMKAAGLNPMMMFGSGSAASTPSGSSIQAPMPQTQSPFAGIGDAVGKAVTSATQAQDLINKSTQNQLAWSEKNRTDEQSHNIGLDSINKAKQYDLISEQVATQAAEKLIKQNDAITARNQMSMDPEWRANSDKGALYGSNASKAIKPVIDVGAQLTNSALRKRGLDLMQERMNQSTHSTTNYDVRPGGSTSSTETWRQ